MVAHEGSPKWPCFTIPVAAAAIKSSLQHPVLALAQDGWHQLGSKAFFSFGIL